MFARQTIVRNARLFSTQVRLQKSATETVKDAAAAVNRTVSDTVVKGIEKGGTYSIRLSYFLQIRPGATFAPQLPHPHHLLISRTHILIFTLSRTSCRNHQEQHQRQLR